jgi:hypothetical protein
MSNNVKNHELVLLQQRAAVLDLLFRRDHHGRCDLVSIVQMEKAYALS